jgi:serine/threonine-protein kinase
VAEIAVPVDAGAIPFPGVNGYNSKVRMSPDQDRRARDVYAAVRREPRHARSTRLAQLCPDDALVRREVERRLAAESAVGEPTSPLALDAAVTLPTSGLSGSGAGAAHARARVVDSLHSAGAWGDFTLVEALGAGAFGAVFRAWDPVLKRDIALKLIDVRRAAAHDPDLVLREGQLMARIRHEHVVSVFSARQIGDEVGLAMEHIRGRTLSAILDEQGAMGVADAVAIGVALADAVAAVHRVGLLHRDIKASNVMREQGGRIVLMDFGAGHETDDGAVPAAPGRTPGTRVVSGTPIYMAPEVITGGAATPASDVYSLGVLLYHLVTRDYPVSGATFADVREAHARGERTPLVAVRPDLPQAYVAVVERALAPAVGDRYPTAAALFKDLTRLAPSVAPPAPALSRRIVAALVVGLGAVVAAAITLAAIGFVTTRVYHRVMARPAAFATEGPVDFVVLGAQATVMPAVVLALVLLIANGVRLGLRLLCALVPPLDRAVSRVGARVSAIRSRIMGPDLDVRTSAAAAVTLVGGAAVFWGFQPLLLALFGNNVDDSPVAALDMLTKAHATAHYAYRLITAGLLFFVIWAAVAIARASQRPGARRPTVGPMMSLAGGALLAFMLNAAPWRVLYATRDLRIVVLEGQSCLVISETAAEALVTCPSAPVPRNRMVPRARLQETGRTIEWLFEAFRTPVTNVVDKR